MDDGSVEPRDRAIRVIADIYRKQHGITSGVPLGVVGLIDAMLYEPSAEQIKLGELVAYLRSLAGSVSPTTAPAFVYSALAFGSVADYIEAILLGDFDSLPWGVAENSHLGRADG